MKSSMRIAFALTLALAGFAAKAQSAPVFEYRHIENPDATVVCSCEHYASQYDGLCNAYALPLDTHVLSWSWTSFGSAWMPEPNDHDDTAYYDSYGYGGLYAEAYYVKSGFYYVNTETGERHLWWPTSRAYASEQCGLWTNGW